MASQLRNRIITRGLAGALFLTANCLPGQTAKADPPAAQSGGSGDHGDLDILSDTQGVNFQPYVHHVLDMVYEHWIPLLPEHARPPQKLAGETWIRFTLSPDGEIAAMHLDGSTHSDALNRAAWGAITGIHTFPRLPDAFHGPNLELRIRFRVNEDVSKKT